MNSERIQIYWQGLVAGIIGHVTIAVVIGVANLALGRSPFHTAALLGQAIFYGLQDPSRLTITPGAVLAYNGFHLLILLAFGLLAAWLVHLSERGPHFWYIGAVLMLFLGFHLLGGLLFLSESVRTAVSPWVLLAAGFAAMGTMAAYLIRVHPKLRSELRDFAAFDSDLEAERD